ncbi:MAG: hypothetical protein LBR92_00240 [Puniceicoccales bacterium]|jgi:hypothetical protein|nr:hypothetical protein [Puniceicoccales bacterium]
MLRTESKLIVGVFLASGVLSNDIYAAMGFGWDSRPKAQNGQSQNVNLKPSKPRVFDEQLQNVNPKLPETNNWDDFTGDRDRAHSILQILKHEGRNMSQRELQALQCEYNECTKNLKSMPLYGRW